MVTVSTGPSRTFTRLVLLLALLCRGGLGRDPPTVTIPDQGTVMGMYMKMFRTQRVVAYLGIPYAQAPVNEKRFTPPVVDNLPSWEGVKNATSPAPHCWHMPRDTHRRHNQLFMELIRSGDDGGGGDGGGDRQYDEDCLFLNIYIPDSTMPTDGYSVLVTFPTGDFDGDTPFTLNPFQMVFKQKIIVVTVAYRLGIFGFFTSMDGEAPGNFGLMDQSAALLWIKRNIRLFNGNEGSVTIMGHGTGAVCPRTAAALKDVPEWVGVPHNFELIFLWGLPYWLALADQMQWDSADKRVADIVMTLWANFAKFTNPTQVGVYIRWEKFTVTEPGVLIIDRSFNMSDHTTMSFDAVKFWNHYYPSVINFAAQCCNATYNGAERGAPLGGSLVAGLLLANLILLQSFLHLHSRTHVASRT
uniref:Carboxylesterase type B domain-containing protein n=1 Tax=Anopheles coluzzii TaxID=1518534 RepID=A0A8W7PI28_ANOCL